VTSAAAAAAAAAAARAAVVGRRLRNASEAEGAARGVDGCFKDARDAQACVPTDSGAAKELRPRALLGGGAVE